MLRPIRLREGVSVVRWPGPMKVAWRCGRVSAITTGRLSIMEVWEVAVCARYESL